MKNKVGRPRQYAQQVNVRLTTDETMWLLAGINLGLWRTISDGVRWSLCQSMARKECNK